VSTTRSALALLREEPTLVGAVLWLWATGDLRTGAGVEFLTAKLFARLAGVDHEELLADLAGDHSTRWPSFVCPRRPPMRFDPFTTRGAVAEWLATLGPDDFAPAVPRALPGCAAA
jgi:hypothetical protein